MSILTDIETTLIDNGLVCYTGYAANGARLPYVVQRPLLLRPDSEAVAGNALAWNKQISLYCCGASVEASFNLAESVMTLLQGSSYGGTTLSTSMGYSGAPVEGHYESQVTVQLNQGEL